MKRRERPSVEHRSIRTAVPVRGLFHGLPRAPRACVARASCVHRERPVSAARALRAAPPGKVRVRPSARPRRPRLATVDEAIHHGARTDAHRSVDAARAFACGVEPRDRAVGHDVEHLGCGIDRDPSHAMVKLRAHDGRVPGTAIEREFLRGLFERPPESGVFARAHERVVVADARLKRRGIHAVGLGERFGAGRFQSSKTGHTPVPASSRRRAHSSSATS